MLQHGYAISDGDQGLTLKPAWAYLRPEAAHFGARTCSEAWPKQAHAWRSRLLKAGVWGSFEMIFSSAEKLELFCENLVFVTTKW